MPRPHRSLERYDVLARFRRSLRATDAAIQRGSHLAGLTVQQQAFLLSVAALGGEEVPLAEIRKDLDMDQATTSEMLGRLVRAKLVTRSEAADRRALTISLTPQGLRTFRRSVRTIAREIRIYQRRGDFDEFVRNAREYFRFYSRLGLVLAVLMSSPL